jgi:hypothetical protein
MVIDVIYNWFVGIFPEVIMKNTNKFISILALTVVIFSLLSVSIPTAKAALIETETRVYLTARVMNKWWYAGNLQCKSATLETLGQTYPGAIQHENWWGLAGNESCFITFAGVPYALASTPSRVTIEYYTLVGDELLDKVTVDRRQTQEKQYLLDRTWYDDYVVLDDMILEDTAALPVINFDPTALPTLPKVKP